MLSRCLFPTSAPTGWGRFWTWRCNMQATEIIDAVSRAGGKLWLEGEKVHARLPESLLALVEDIRRYKPEIMILLSDPVERSMVDHDPRAWAEDFQRWALGCCVWRDRCFGGI